MAVTLNANILAQQVASQLGKGVSADDPNSRIPGTEAYIKYQAAILAAQTVSAQDSNQRDAAAVTVSNSAQNICSGEFASTRNRVEVKSGNILPELSYLVLLVLRLCQNYTVDPGRSLFAPLVMPLQRLVLMS